MNGRPCIPTFTMIALNTMPTNLRNEYEEKSKQRRHNGTFPHKQQQQQRWWQRQKANETASRFSPIISSWAQRHMHLSIPFVERLFVRATIHKMLTALDNLHLIVFFIYAFMSRFPFCSSPLSVGSFWLLVKTHRQRHSRQFHSFSHNTMVHYRDAILSYRRGTKRASFLSKWNANICPATHLIFFFCFSFCFIRHKSNRYASSILYSTLIHPHYAPHSVECVFALVTSNATHVETSRKWMRYTEWSEKFITSTMFSPYDATKGRNQFYGSCSLC